MDYGYPEKRKNKNDSKSKRKNRVYKKGGKYRSSEVSEESKK